MFWRIFLFSWLAAPFPSLHSFLSLPRSSCFLYNPQPPRTAHPIVKFSCTDCEPMVIDKLPFDKYELEASPLTQYILERKSPHTCWQVNTKHWYDFSFAVLLILSILADNIIVTRKMHSDLSRLNWELFYLHRKMSWQLIFTFVQQVFFKNSAKYSDLGCPYGYLKASTTLTCVNLFVMPYNYPVLLPLLGKIPFMCVHHPGLLYCIFCEILICQTNVDVLYVLVLLEYNADCPRLFIINFFPWISSFCKGHFQDSLKGLQNQKFMFGFT